MTTLTGDSLFAIVALLLVASAWMAAYRPRPRDAGLAAGAALIGIALALLWNPVLAVRLHLDDVSLPSLAPAGAVLVALFATMPKRQLAWSVTNRILALFAVNLAVLIAPNIVVTALAWAASCFLTGAVLPAGPARRLAFPYLVLAAGAGVAGLILGGGAGAGLLLMAVVVRLGVFPFHSWVAAAYHLAPTGIAVAVTAPMSAIALIARSPIGLDGTVGTTVTVGLAVAALLAAGLALIQTELSRAVGLLTVSVQTVVMVALLDSDDIGHLGGLMMWNLTGLALVGLGLVVDVMRSRVGFISLTHYSGLLAKTPVFAAMFLLFGLAAVGAPGTADFASEDLVLHGGLAHHPALLLGFIAAVSAQGYAVIHLFFRVFYGPPSGLLMADALPRERASLVMLGAVLVLAGLAPQVLVNGWLTKQPPADSQHTSVQE